MSKFNLTKFKRDLRNNVITIYRKKGYAIAKLSIDKLIKDSNKKSKELNQPELAVQIRGECCELALELELWEFIRKHKLPWTTSKGLCIKRTDNKRFKTTELDLTLFTPSKIILFESKYRKGKITLTDKCTLVPDWGHATDVYKQNIMHLTNLKDYLSDCILTLQRGKPFSIVLYVDDTNRVKDLRDDNSKKLMPVISSDNINSYLESIRKLNTNIWDMKKIKETLTKLDNESEENMVRHMKEVAKQ